MFTGFRVLLVALTVVGALLVGCKKSAPSDSNSTSPPAVLKAKAATVSHLHWLGRKRIAAQTNATSLIALWDLPEGAKLQAQTLDKLSSAPWQLLRAEAGATNAGGALLRPLLDDIVQEESYIELRQTVDQPAEVVFAIRLDETRSELWRTNLAASFESLTGMRTTSAGSGGWGWSLKKQESPQLFQLARAGNWTVLGAASDTNSLLGEMLARINRDHSPLVSSRPGRWLEASVDLAGIAKMFSPNRKLPEQTPHITLAVSFQGENIRTEGDLIFPKPLMLELEPWNIPTNLINEHLVGFTAVRGFGSWLAAAEPLRGVFNGPPPNQFFLWTLPGLPAQAYFATPLSDASNQVRALSTRFLEVANPLLATNDKGRFSWSEDQNGITAQGIPFLSPFFRAYVSNGVEFAFGGTLTPPPVLGPPPEKTLQIIAARTNLVYLDRELSGPRVVPWLYLGQLLRLITRKSQIPFDSAMTAWSKAAESRLGLCDTMITRTDPVTLHFLRESTIGFTALELHILADWLESPQFPRGLHTFLVQPKTPASDATQTNAPPEQP